MYHDLEPESYCALCNTYKLKCWLTIRNNSNSSYDNSPSENWSERKNSGNFSIQFKNQKRNIIRNIEAWKKNIVTEKMNQNEDKRQTSRK